MLSNNTTIQESSGYEVNLRKGEAFTYDGKRKREYLKIESLLKKVEAGKTYSKVTFKNPKRGSSLFGIMHDKATLADETEFLTRKLINSKRFSLLKDHITELEISGYDFSSTSADEKNAPFYALISFIDGLTKIEKLTLKNNNLSAFELSVIEVCLFGNYKGFASQNKEKTITEFNFSENSLKGDKKIVLNILNKIGSNNPKITVRYVPPQYLEEKLRMLKVLYLNKDGEGFSIKNKEKIIADIKELSSKEQSIILEKLLRDLDYVVPFTEISKVIHEFTTSLGIKRKEIIGFAAADIIYDRCDLAISSNLSNVEEKRDAIMYLKDLAALGNSDAQYQIGKMYCGEKIAGYKLKKPNELKGLKLLVSAKRKGVDKAWDYLSRDMDYSKLSEKGKYFLQNENYNRNEMAKALEVMQKAYDDNDPVARENLIIFYENKIALDIGEDKVALYQDQSMLLKLRLEKIKQKKDLSFAECHSVIQDFAKEFGIKRKEIIGFAAADIIYEACESFINSNSSDSDLLSEAAKYLFSLGKGGHPGAQYQMGKMHLEKKMDSYGYESNRVNGLKLLNSAAKKGFEDAKKYLSVEAIARSETTSGQDEDVLAKLSSNDSRELEEKKPGKIFSTKSGKTLDLGVSITQK